MIFPIAAPADYVSLTQELTFNSTATTRCARIRIIDDLNLEDTETLDVILFTSDLDVSLESPAATVTILDNDGVVIGFEMTAYNASETQGSVEICVVVTSGTIQRPLVGDLMTTDITTGWCTRNPVICYH